MFDWVESLNDDEVGFASLEDFVGLDSSPNSIINSCNVYPFEQVPTYDDDVREETKLSPAASDIDSDNVSDDSRETTIFVKTESDENTTDIEDQVRIHGVCLSAKIVFSINFKISGSETSVNIPCSQN